MSTIESPLAPCGCCEGIRESTPASIDNMPGLDAIRYRIGTHATFIESMLARLGGEPRLRALTTRATDDPTIALVDAWATTLDVLTFYQERIANEGYLRTATERRSLLELSYAIGYRLGSGVAASTVVAFNLESAAPSPSRLTIAAGARLQSLPGPGEKPQTFETIEEIEARPDWNAMPAATSEPQTIAAGVVDLYLAGNATRLQKGDPLLIVGDDDPENDKWNLRRVAEISLDKDAGITKVTLNAALDSDAESSTARVYALRTRAALYGSNAPQWRAMPEDFKDEYRDSDDVEDGEWPDFSIDEINDEVGASGDVVHLDGLYPKVATGSWVVLSKPTDTHAFTVVDVTERTPALFTLTNKVSQLELSGYGLSHFNASLRTTSVYLESEELALAEHPMLDAETPSILSPVSGSSIRLDRFVEGLTTGQRVVVAGRRLRGRIAVSSLSVTSADGATEPLDLDESVQLLLPPADAPDETREWSVRTREGFEGIVSGGPGDIVPEASLDEDETVAEAGVIDEVEADGTGPVTIVLEKALVGIYDRATVRVHGNAAEATHGETKTETLGSGDASKPFQSFSLRNTPLTYITASTASGSESTLEIRVDGVLWHEVPSLFGRGPREQVFVTRTEDDGPTVVQFGDGITGARLPSGVENVKATYRVGTGLDGEVDAGQLSLLLTRPLGLKGVIGPIAPSGAEDPEQLVDARTNAPLTVLTLDRIVSLQDFEDFTRAFAGIGKAQAAWLWNGTTRLVHITVATASGGGVDPDSKLYEALTDAITGATDGLQLFAVESFTDLRFKLHARILVHEDYLTDDVFAAIELRLLDEFSFTRRAFAQSVTSSEVIATIQNVPGVVMVDLESLYTGTTETRESILPAHRARVVDDVIAPAELLVISPIGITLTEITP